MLKPIFSHLACLALALILCTPLLHAAEPRPQKPNIVFILLDNVGREWFGCYGSEEGCTPNIDRLAQAGVRFQNCYTTVVCGPSRVELLTGRYPHRTGWYYHHDAALYSGGGFDPRREVTIARVLRDHGYATGLAGKWQVNNLYDEPDVLTQHGFQEHLVWPGSIDRDRVDDAFWKSFRDGIARRDAPFLTEATRQIESRYWDPVLLRNGQRERVKDRFGPDVFAEFALSFIRRHRDEPFFFYYPMVLTHGQNASEPVVVTPANRAAPPKDEKAKFADMLRYADKQVGEFFTQLDQLGLRDNTIVFIATDNGTEKNLSARANGRTVQGGLYQINEAGGNVPLMVICPARIAGGRTAALADFTDIFPTICDLTQSPPPKDVKLDGKSFSSFLKGEGKAPREWIFNEYGPDRVVRDERYKLNHRGQMFDLANDPDEQHPLAAFDAAATAAKAKLKPVLDGMPPMTPLPFEHRSLSAFKFRGKTGDDGWRTLPLILDGKVAGSWARVGWGGFVVDNGALRAEPDDRGMGLLLNTTEKFGDCELRIVYRCEKAKSNAGIYVRLDEGVLRQVGEKSPEVHRDGKGKLAPEMIDRLKEASEKHLGAWYPVHHGYEVQIMDAANPLHRTGAIYSLAPAAPAPAKPQDEWRTMIIRLEGECIIVDQDGQRLSSFDAIAKDLLPRKNWTEPVREIKRPTHGYIGLQSHDPGDVVWFKEISVRPLEAKNSGQEAKPAKTTVTYKQTGGVEIKADVYATQATEPRPAVVWIHGGGLINGHREQLSSQVRDFAFANGYVLVSLDYRLAPETKLPAILTDIEDAMKWLRSEGAKQFNIDPQRIAVTGGSAGGFLTLASGFRANPPPRALLAFWGYGELLTDWACGPSPHPRHNQKKISDEDAASQSGGPVVADSRERKGDGGAIYLHGRQTGSWAQDVSGLDPRREPEKFTPLLPLKNVTAKYPPTVLVHGTADTDVPFEQSQLMVREFQKHGVKHELLTIENGEHGLGGGKPEDIAEAYRKAFEFLKRELQKP